MKMIKPRDPYNKRDEHILKSLRESAKPFIRGMLIHPNSNQAATLVEGHAGESFDRVYAGEMESLKRDAELAKERDKALQAEVVALQAQRRATNSYRTVSACNGSDEHQRSAFAFWSLKDQMIFCCSLVFMVIVLSAGAGNVYSAIMAKAIPIFLEHPMLGVLLSCLLPAGSVALHSVGEFLGSDRARHRYALLISCLTFVLLMAWAILFGLTFQIGDDAIVLEDLIQHAEPTSPTSSIYTIVQLLAELFCGTALALTASHTHGRYSRDTTISNDEMEFLDRRIAQIQTRLETPGVSRQAVERQAKLQAMRKAHGTEMVALYWTIRRRFDQASPLSMAL